VSKELFQLAAQFREDIATEQSRLKAHVSSKKEADRSASDVARRWEQLYADGTSKIAVMERDLHEAFSSLQVDIQQQRAWTELELTSIGARIDELSSGEMPEWYLRLKSRHETTDLAQTSMDALMRYISLLRPEWVRYRGGLESTAAQLGAELYKAYGSVLADPGGADLAEATEWLSHRHPGYALVIARPGNGFDDRIHQSSDAAVSPQSGVAMIRDVENWGLMETGSTERTIFKAVVSVE